MTAAEFLRELTKVRELFEWKLVPDNDRVPERRSHPRLHIRALCKGFKKPLFDPISALYYARAKVIIPPSSWLKSAKALKLVDASAWYIMAAADDQTWRTVGDTRKPHPQIIELRRQLAAAVCLELTLNSSETNKPSMTVSDISPL